ncbi:N-formylglutamate amidohydrolase [Formosa sp. S-31]|uniref:N-formylglutamate amidohydrolase n=1 Tax=Formosa sp. S-31 TaxID=2790949 RepID=UPI003EBE028C
MKLVLTCEHGGCNIPGRFAYLFDQAGDILQSHRGYDMGALDLFEYLKPLSEFSKYSETSRLLIELNRSLHHKNLFSEFTKPLSKSDKSELILTYYNSYRNSIEDYISEEIQQGNSILHISVHSFTPILNNNFRNCDVGLLYAPEKTNESLFCKTLKTNLTLINPELKVRYNYPYLGTADGFTTYLRKTFKTNYSGIELEVNQKFVLQNKMPITLKQYIYKALQACLSR